MVKTRSGVFFVVVILFCFCFVLGSVCSPVDHGLFDG